MSEEARLHAQIAQEVRERQEFLEEMAGLDLPRLAFVFDKVILLQEVTQIMLSLYFHFLFFFFVF